MFKKVSCCPAKEASGKSSAVADERTATAISGLPFERAVNAARISCSKVAVSGDVLNTKQNYYAPANTTTGAGTKGLASIGDRLVSSVLNENTFTKKNSKSVSNETSRTKSPITINNLQ